MADAGRAGVLDELVLACVPDVVGRDPDGSCPRASELLPLDRSVTGDRPEASDDFAAPGRAEAPDCTPTVGRTCTVDRPGTP